MSKFNQNRLDTMSLFALVSKAVLNLYQFEDFDTISDVAKHRRFVASLWYAKTMGSVLTAHSGNSTPNSFTARGISNAVAIPTHSDIASSFILLE